VSGDQLLFPTAAVFSFPWDRFFDQGERVFETVFLLLWLGFVAFLIFYAQRMLLGSRHKGKKRPKKLRKTLIPRLPKL
jgi:hypothetical protein